MRCFIAIDFPRNIMNDIEKVQIELKNKQIFHGKLTEKENLAKKLVKVVAPRVTAI